MQFVQNLPKKLDSQVDNIQTQDELIEGVDPAEMADHEGFGGHETKKYYDSADDESK